MGGSVADDASDAGSRAEVLDEDEKEITDQDVVEYAEYLGIDPDEEEDLMWIAREGVAAPIPEPWKACQEDGEVFYFNFQTSESSWDHPCDAHYKKLVDEYRAKRGQGGSPPGSARRSDKDGEGDSAPGSEQPRSPSPRAESPVVAGLRKEEAAAEDADGSSGGFVSEAVESSGGESPRADEAADKSEAAAGSAPEVMAAEERSNFSDMSDEEAQPARAAAKPEEVAAEQRQEEEAPTARAAAKPAEVAAESGEEADDASSGSFVSEAVESSAGSSPRSDKAPASLAASESGAGATKEPEAPASLAGSKGLKEAAEEPEAPSSTAFPEGPKEIAEQPKAPASPAASEQREEAAKEPEAGSEHSGSGSFVSEAVESSVGSSPRRSPPHQEDDVQERAEVGVTADGDTGPLDGSDNSSKPQEPHGARAKDPGHQPGGQEEDEPQQSSLERQAADKEEVASRRDSDLDVESEHGAFSDSEGVVVDDDGKEKVRPDNPRRVLREEAQEEGDKSSRGSSPPDEDEEEREEEALDEKARRGDHAVTKTSQEKEKDEEEEEVGKEEEDANSQPPSPPESPVAAPMTSAQMWQQMAGGRTSSKASSASSAPRSQASAAQRPLAAAQGETSGHRSDGSASAESPRSAGSPLAAAPVSARSIGSHAEEGPPSLRTAGSRDEDAPSSPRSAVSEGPEDRPGSASSRSSQRSGPSPRPPAEEPSKPKVTIEVAEEPAVSAVRPTTSPGSDRVTPSRSPAVFDNIHSARSSNLSEVSEDFRSDWDALSPPGSGRRGVAEPAAAEGLSLEVSASIDTEGGSSKQDPTGKHFPGGSMAERGPSFPTVPEHGDRDRSASLDSEEVPAAAQLQPPQAAMGNTKSWAQLRLDVQGLQELFEAVRSIRLKEEEYLRCLTGSI